MEFKIVYTLYNQSGALTSDTHCEYFGTADAAEQKFNELNRLRYPDTGYRMYKVDLQLLTYKTVEDAAAFFEQFHV